VTVINLWAHPKYVARAAKGGGLPLRTGRWQPVEDKILLDLYGDEIAPFQAIAEALHRSPASVYGRLRRLQV
jgi:hypothetical protein